MVWLWRRHCRNERRSKKLLDGDVDGQGGKDADTWYSWYCNMELKFPVDYFVNLTQKQQAVQMAFIDKKLEMEKKENQRIKASARK